LRKNSTFRIPAVFGGGYEKPVSSIAGTVSFRHASQRSAGTSNFSKTAKVIKRENDIKIGMRPEADGPKIALRGGKVISRYQFPGSKNNGLNSRVAAPKAKLNEYRRGIGAVAR
jgi:hypothetical protein